MRVGADMIELDTCPALEKRIVAELHISELDGIRAAAVWMVILGHMQGGWGMPAHVKNSIPKLLGLALGHGWLGVDLFFVLSGFLITVILLDSREKPYSAKKCS